MLEPSPRDGVLTTVHSPRGSYEIDKEIAVGAHSTVFLAKSLTTMSTMSISNKQVDISTSAPNIVALKRLDKRKMKEDTYAMCSKEVEYLARLKHPGIVLLHESFIDGPYLCIVLDYYVGGDLLTLVNSGGSIVERRAKHYTKQLAMALKYAHNSGVVHRDIKLENILLDESHETVVLCDWGFATTYREGRRQKGAVGSPHYASPEVHRGVAYEGPEVDSWSLGVVIYAITTGSLPWRFPGMLSRETPLSSQKELILHASYCTPSGMNKDLVDLIANLLTLNQLARFTMQQILEHAWVQEAYMH